MKKSVYFFLLLFISFSLISEVLRYKYNKGEKYRIIATVNENVYFNNQYLGREDMLYRIGIEVVDTKEKSGELRGHFRISMGVNTSYQYIEEHFSDFWRDERGNYTIDPSFLFPVVRNVPIFPEIDIKPGDTWSARGEEAHDFSRNHNIKGVFHFPFDVNYEYVGKVEKDGKILDKIRINYAVFYNVPVKPGASGRRILRIIGKSEQEYYWDNSSGKPYFYSEVFDFIHFMSTGDMWEYTGKAEARVIESESFNKPRIIEEIEKQIEDTGIKDTNVKAVEEGISLTMENIQFDPESAVLLPSEIEKLEKISQILRKYSDRDLLLIGHTAKVGTEESCRILSVKRAASVGNFLLSKGIRRKDQIIICGKGFLEPIADNLTREGRRRNRRVEIIILEN